jgi:hypothetical protein
MKELKNVFSQIETLIQCELDMIENYESQISDLENEINEYEDEMFENPDDYDLSYVNEKWDEINTLNSLIEKCEREIEYHENTPQ